MAADHAIVVYCVLRDALLMLSFLLRCVLPGCLLPGLVCVATCAWPTEDTRSEGTTSKDTRSEDKRLAGLRSQRAGRNSIENFLTTIVAVMRCFMFWFMPWLPLHTHALKDAKRRPVLRRLRARVGSVGLSVLAGWAGLAGVSGVAHAGPFKAPEIFVLGDSQLAFGAGRVFYDFFKGFKDNCGSAVDAPRLVRQVDGMSVGVMGVRSTSIHSWVSRKWVRKKMICKPDPKWGVNARLFGWKKHRDASYVQLGRAADFRVCRQGRSVLQSMLAKPTSHPRLLVLFFMGNSVGRWANARAKTTRDLRKLKAQLPIDMPCVIMTTAPSYRKRENRVRWRAQAGLRRAVNQVGLRCAFVAGHTRQTVAAMQSNARYYRRYRSGRVKDPYHPNHAGAARFMVLRRQAICSAVIAQMKRKAPMMERPDKNELRPVASAAATIR